jgi:hypothetical protein
VVAFNKSTKEAGIYNGFWNAQGNDGLQERIAMASQFFRERNIIKAKSTNKIIFTKEKYHEFPNFYLSNFDLKNPQRISDLNLNIRDTFN